MKSIILCMAMIMAVGTVWADTKVVAHRGYWKTPGASSKDLPKCNLTGSAQNSLAAYKKADALNIYGSEIDVWISTDGEVYVNHDRVFKGCEIQKSTSAECKKVILDNGQKMPTLKSYLKTVKKGKCQLVCEIKTHKDPARTKACVEKVLQLVKAAKLEKRVDYIAFSWDACLQLKKEAPAGTEIYYLNGDKSPQEIKAAGLTGVDYEARVMIDKHPEWLQQLKDLGLKINIWTIDDAKTMQYYIDKQVDFITTNEPELCKSLVK